ncbi:MAG: 23S rRNA (guanosine(2251)-2'-O)-methyltransferase RlmB [Myxococcota bacterium]
MKRLLGGTRAVAEALRGRTGRSLAVVYVEQGNPRARQAVEADARGAGVPLEERPREELDRLAKGMRHQGVLAVGGEYPYVDLPRILEEAVHPPLLVALDEVSDPQNFGAIVRSAVAFGVDGVLTLKRRAAPVTPAVVRASAGATEHARIARVTNLARTLRALRDDPGLEVVGLDASGDRALESLDAAPAGRVLVVGSEGKGLRRLVRESCDVVVRIPLAGPIASLNASVAAAVAMYEAARARRREGESP